MWDDEDSQYRGDDPCITIVNAEPWTDNPYGAFHRRDSDEVQSPSDRLFNRECLR